ncbi:MAG TPA: bacillithiol biosynthesis cysteine-adding enzyme BshC [Terriglobales bacterium]|nr:bacillithiol biosynthesis cysteine-adding enzyme BshC [Terriglobales bacterium]
MNPALFEAYCGGAARRFYGSHFAEPEDRRRAVARAVRPLDPSIAAALSAQNARLPPSPARDANLARLRGGAAAAVTGQQVGLFLGPLFTLYKAASAIRVARALTEESGQPVVPVFWLQVEDHDLAEIAHCDIRPHGEPLRLAMPADPAERISLAHLCLPEEIAGCVATLTEQLRHLPHGESHLERVARHYQPGRSWADAFAGLLAELFAEEGLVLIDPRDATLAAAAAEVHHRAIAQADGISDRLLARAAELHTAGFATQVHVRPGAPLSFYHPRGASGPRYRLEPCAEGYAEAGGDGVHRSAELLACLERDPHCFSTSVLLRPLLQDSWLPTAAYIGGPAEVSYFAQLPPVYAAFDKQMPLIVPRASLRLLEEKLARRLHDLKLTAADLQRNEDELLARAGAGAGLPGEEIQERLLAGFDLALEELRPQLEAAGEGLDIAAEKTRATVAAAVAKLSSKYESARLHRDRTLVAELRRMQQWLFPGGIPQERHYGMPYFAARHGEAALLRAVLDNIVPFDPTVRDVVL